MRNSHSGFSFVEVGTGLAAVLVGVRFWLTPRVAVRMSNVPITARVPRHLFMQAKQIACTDNVDR